MQHLTCGSSQTNATYKIIPPLDKVMHKQEHQTGSMKQTYGLLFFLNAFLYGTLDSWHDEEAGLDGLRA